MPKAGGWRERWSGFERGGSGDRQRRDWLDWAGGGTQGRRYDSGGIWEDGGTLKIVNGGGEGKGGPAGSEGMTSGFPKNKSMLVTAF